MSFLERIRRFWSSAPPPDHPLSAQERDERRSASADDEKTRVLESLAGDDFDPDDDPAAGH
ncbi:MAG TPA: hypothetical protein VF101_20290 [Gaiellaceae bacterium]